MMKFPYKHTPLGVKAFKTLFDVIVSFPFLPSIHPWTKLLGFFLLFTLELFG
jgi:hypothetical protein